MYINTGEIGCITCMFINFIDNNSICFLGAIQESRNAVGELGVFDLGYFSITKVYEPMLFKIMRVGVNNFQKKCYVTPEWHLIWMTIV